MNDSVRLRAGGAGKWVRVNRCLLAAASPLIRAGLEAADPTGCHSTHDVILPDLSYSGLQSLVTLLQTGRVQHLTRRNSRHLVSWVRTLGIVSTLSETLEEGSSSEAKVFVVEDPAQKARTEAEETLCQLCNKTFHSAAYMKTHLLTHTGEMPFQCPQCDQAFRYKETLNAHLRSTHGDSSEGAGLFSCHVCGKQYLYKKDLKTHAECHEQTPAPAPCKLCGKVLKNKASLKSHLRSFHSKVEPKDLSAVRHNCIECGKVFKRKQDLRAHFRTHTGERPYPCRVCGKSFGLASNFSKHRRTHSDEENTRAGNYYNVTKKT